ncbi:MAG: hypothetical protein V3W31_06685 [Thermodesulfobacteriota bacterium]
MTKAEQIRVRIVKRLRWVSSEPNSEALWVRIRADVEKYLWALWRAKKLYGASPDEAYFVKYDRDTMTRSDINEGRIIIECGVATERPAEFVRFKVAIWAGPPPRK